MCVIEQGAIYGLQVRVQHVPPAAANHEASAGQDDLGHGIGRSRPHYRCSHHPTGVPCVR